MSLREDFKDIGYEMARMITAEIEKIGKKTSMEIYYINERFENHIHNDLLQLEVSTIKKRQFELNKDEIERSSKINQTISERKTKHIEEFLEILKIEIRNRIQTCHESYSEFLIEKIKSYLPLINQEVQVQFHKEDLKYIKEANFFEKLGEKGKLFEFSEIPLDSCIGFKIISKNKDYEIDYTFNAITEKHQQKLKMRFMKIFPVFEINLRNAMEIDREKHGGASRYDI
ncbi:MAG: hypothetical protein ACTSVZ_12105 [Promethearchaeota archaeon]